MKASSSLINNNIVTQETLKFEHTCMVSHLGSPVSFAMDQEGRVFYSVLNISNADDSTNNDKNYWSDISFDKASASRLYFPLEVTQIGFEEIPNFRIDNFDDTNKKIVAELDEEGNPLDSKGNKLTAQGISELSDSFNSSTARLGAIAPFQVLSDGKYIYIFRQSIGADHANNADPFIVNDTLLMDRFILSGSLLKPRREIRYQRSGHKTRPESAKDTLSPVDVEGNAFYEPTKELAFVNNLKGGNFSVLLIPGKDSEEKRWQIFAGDNLSNKINSFNIKFDESIVFDTSDSETVIHDFIERHELDNSLITDIQEKIRAGQTDEQIAGELSGMSPYKAKNITNDDWWETIYTLRTGVQKDDFILESTSEWPLIDYDDDGDIKNEYLDQLTLLEKYTFQGDSDQLLPQETPYSILNGLTSCYYHQQETGADGKPMKNKACVMLALGLSDESGNDYIGILNFSVASSGRISRLTTDRVNMPDINVQALDENPYENLGLIKDLAWQEPQKMRLLDIDSDGLSTSGGVLKFSYTDAAIGESQGYSDAIVATAPYLFDDSLGRVNLYFKGKNNNFFVLYFNPTGSKASKVTDSELVVAVPQMSLKSRLDRDMIIQATALVAHDKNTCALSFSSKEEIIEQWNFLPKKYSQIAAILNGNKGHLLGTLDPLGIANDPRAAYIKSISGVGEMQLRTTKVNNLIFNNETAFADQLGSGIEFSISLDGLSGYLSNNTSLSIANKSFTVIGDVKIKSDLFFKSYFSALMDDVQDFELLWDYLISKSLIEQDEANNDRATLGVSLLEGDIAALSMLLIDTEIDALSLSFLKEGNIGDRNARRARLKQTLIELLLDIANVRIITLTVQDTNATSVERLEAGLALNVFYDYSSNYTSTPANLTGTSASVWEHERSYLFSAVINYDEYTSETTQITDEYDYQFDINNTIGQWEDWEASLALEMIPESATNGVLLNTNDQEKLNALKPSSKGVSVESWIKPSKASPFNGPQSIIHFKKDAESYSLGIEKDSTNAANYKCFASLGNKKYTSQSSFPFEKDSANYWRHLAFTHKKHWGYQLGAENRIHCGSDNSLVLNDEFTIEVFLEINSTGTILEKKGEYSLIVNRSGEIGFYWRNTNYLAQISPSKLTLNKFYKITVIRSKNKPQDSTVGISNLAGDVADGAGSGWYEDQSSEDIIKGMAARQEEMDKKFLASQTSMFGLPSKLGEKEPVYYHTLVITDENGDAIARTTENPEKIDHVEAFLDFVIGGNQFSGNLGAVRIWNRALSINEAESLGAPENDSGLLSHWQITEGVGKYLYDNTSENHGVASGGNWVGSPQTNEKGHFQFYVDGTLEPHEIDSGQEIEPLDQFSIAGVQTESSAKHHYAGSLEEIRIWNLPRTGEQISDNAFGRLKGEWEQLLANYTFDKFISESNGKVQDSSVNSVQLDIQNFSMLEEQLSTAPVATEIPQVRSALTGVLTAYNGSILSRPGVSEYGDIQQKDDGTMSGILKRCYSFIDAEGKWYRMTGYKVGNLISEWFSQAQFDPQVVGFMEGPPPVPQENFAKGDEGSFKFNVVKFKEAEKVAYNYSTSKDSGWNIAVDSENKDGVSIDVVMAPFGIGQAFESEGGISASSNWSTTGNRSNSFERGNSVNVDRGLEARLSGFNAEDNGSEDRPELGNTGYALVKSKTADIYLLRLEHNKALVSISWQPNPDIPEDVNIITFPMNPLYTKQGTLDGKVGEFTDNHYPQAHGAYGEYSYFKPKEAYRLKKQIEREKMELKAYFEDAFDVSKMNRHFNAASATTGIIQSMAFIPFVGPAMTSLFNQSLGQVATTVGYNNTKLKDDLSEMGSQRNLVNTYVWTMEGGFYSESTQVAETQQETYSSESNLELGGGAGMWIGVEAFGNSEQQTMFSSGSSFTLTKSKSEEASSSFGLDLSLRIPNLPRYKYAGNEGRTLVKGPVKPGTVDAYRFMSFYLEPKGKNFMDLFTKVIDPIWLDESSDPNAKAMRQARGNVDKAKPCWRIMHRVTYVSRILPEFKPEAPPSLNKTLSAAGIESNYLLIKKFEPYVANISDSGEFFAKVEEIINTQLLEFVGYKRQIKQYLALYFNIDQT